MTNEQRVELWKAINHYAEACGGDPSRGVYGSTARQSAVALIESILTALSAGEGLREAIQAFSDELDDWCNARPVPPVDYMTMQCGPKMVAAWDRVIRALSAPAPQEER